MGITNKYKVNELAKDFGMQTKQIIEILGKYFETPNDNAVKYRNEDIEPELTVRTTDIDGNRLRIQIRDNGIGMKKEDLKKIFEKFYRVHTGNRHDVKGFGLGLAYVNRMVHIFDGTISVESELGKGSEFTIELPLAAEN